MRRGFAISIAFLISASCSFRPVFVDPSTIGTPRPKTASAAPAGVEACTEVTRVKCDIGHCKEANRDRVTLRCKSGEITRCELGKGGC
jgi:hypothetical protein